MFYSVISVIGVQRYMGWHKTPQVYEPPRCSALQFFKKVKNAPPRSETYPPGIGPYSVIYLLLAVLYNWLLSDVYIDVHMMPHCFVSSLTHLQHPSDHHQTHLWILKQILADIWASQIELVGLLADLWSTQQHHNTACQSGISGVILGSGSISFEFQHCHSNYHHQA